MTAYYNEHDPQAAAWLRELIKAGLIAPGDVDERSIEDVVPNELVGYTQCHFFAGIGGWPYALRCAGWPDSRPAWTGSCPCQPFSAAGKRGGTADERHLWPAFYHLISQSRPDVVFGEQVASVDGLDWLDVVYADLEAAGYAVGALDLCAAGLGAPHIRQRLYFVADAELPERRSVAARGQYFANGAISQGKAAGGSELYGEVGDMADAPSQRHDGRRASCESGEQERPERSRDARGMGDAASKRRGETRPSGGRSEEWVGDAGEFCGMGSAAGTGSFPGAHGRLRCGEEGQGTRDAELERSGVTRGFWRDAEWIYCRDGKYRAVESVSESVADGLAGDLGLVRLQSYPDRPHEERFAYAPLISKGKKRVMRLRGYGNAIVAPVAEAFVKAYLETI